MPYTDATPSILKRAVNLTLDDEIACVLSLVAGVRLRSGGLVRRFEKEDSRGTPQFYAHVAPDWVATRRPAHEGRPFLVFRCTSAQTLSIGYLISMVTGS